MTFLVYNLFPSIFFPLFVITFFIYSARFLIQHVHVATLPIPLIALLGLFYTLMFLLKTGCTDPGFIPRARSDEASYNKGLGDLGM